MKYYILSYLLGIAVHSVFFSLDYISIIYIVCVSISISVLFAPKISFKLIFCSIFFLLGIYLFSIHLSPDLSLIEYIGERNTFEGKVVSEIINKADYQQFALGLENGEKILVKTSSLSLIRYGDYVSVSGKLALPESFKTESGRVFDYPMYLRKDSIFYVLSYAQVMSVELKDLSWGERVVRVLYDNKERLIDRANKKIPQPHSALLSGILYGKKGAMDTSLDEQFRRVGLTHIVVLSGYNVSLVINLFLRVLSFVPLKLRSFFAFLGIISFALLVGAGPTVVRASIMAGILVLSGLLHREYDVIRALVIAGVIMVSINPFILLFDISFQLSFLATFSLIHVSERIEKYFTWVPNVFELRSSLVATISAQIFVLPLIFYQIGEFSVISLLVNTIVLFAVPYAMFFGFITSVLPEGIFLEINSFLAYIYLEYIIKLVKYFSRYELISIPPFSIYLLILIYLILFSVLYVKRDEV